MKVKRLGITEILRRIWLFFANKIKSSASFSKQPTQLIVELNSSLRHIIVTYEMQELCSMYFNKTTPASLMRRDYDAPCSSRIASSRYRLYIFWRIYVLCDDIILCNSKSPAAKLISAQANRYE